MSVPFDFQIALDKLPLNAPFKEMIKAVVVAGQQFDFDLFSRSAEGNRDTLKDLFKVLFDKSAELVQRDNVDMDYFNSGCVAFEEDFSSAYFDAVEAQAGGAGRPYPVMNHQQQGLAR